jgi:hypothetical protein
VKVSPRADHGSVPLLVSASSCPLDRFLPLTLHPLRLTLRFPLSDPGHTDTGLWIRPSRTILSSRMEPNGKCAPSAHAHPRRSLGRAIRSFFQDNFFSKLSTIRQQSSPESAYAIPKKECESKETVLSLRLKDGSNLKYPTNSLSGIGVIARMPQIL